MRDTCSLGTWLQRFLVEHSVQDRNLSLNTQHSYRDTLVLLLAFLTRKLRKAADHLSLEDLSEDVVRSFLLDLEKSRHSRIRTRNHRLSALRSLARFIGMRSPEYLPWAGRIRDIPLKRSGEPLAPYLEDSEMQALLRLPDRQTQRGHRDYTLLLFLIQHRVPGRRSGTIDDRRPGFSASPPERTVLRQSDGQRAESPPLPSLASDCGATHYGDRRPSVCRARFPEPLRAAPNPVWNPQSGAPLRSSAGQTASLDRQNKSEPAYDSTFRGDSSLAVRRGHQHHLRLAWPCFGGYDQPLCPD